jgi:hypothetical protein
MTKRLLLETVLGLIVCGAASDAAAGKGVGTMAAPEGVTVPGIDHRYIAISPRIPEKITVVAHIERNGGHLGRSWYLRGSYFVPAVAYDFSAGGLSADGRTLVLTRLSHSYPPETTRFAILDTQRSFEWRGPGRPPRFRNFFDYIDLRGDFSFDAISPDGSTLYLIQRYLPPSSGGSYITHYKVRAYDLERGRLLPRPIVDPEEPDERMAGLPVTRASSPDGRWAYTLYDGDGGEPFIHALDTVRRTAVCIDLPQLAGRRFEGRRLNAFTFNLRLHHDQGGRQLTVMSAPPPPRELPPISQGRPVSYPVPHPLLSLNTDTFEVTKAGASAAGVEEQSGLPWLPLGIAAVAALFAVAWRARA